jgi:hypothetical protein
MTASASAFGALLPSEPVPAKDRCPPRADLLPDPNLGPLRSD